jgi:NADH dehydrogenase [ubiquinone] 1 alpha subcomplex assembly factor 5
MVQNDIFKEVARRLRRTRVAMSKAEDRWIITRVANELLDRWQEYGNFSGTYLVLGFDNGFLSTGLMKMGAQVVVADPGYIGVPDRQDIMCHEGVLPFRDAAFDGIFSVMTLDTVNDLPGALILIRRALKPGGVFHGAFLGAGSGQTLRQIVRDSSVTDTAIGRHHPLIDVRAAGDLLARARFERPVSDTETINVEYQNLDRLLSDMKANGLTNVLADRLAASKAILRTWQHAFQLQRNEGGRVSEQFCPVYLTGFAPDQSQEIGTIS